jgi:hypothetical protein
MLTKIEPKKSPIKKGQSVKVVEVRACHLSVRHGLFVDCVEHRVAAAASPQVEMVAHQNPQERAPGPNSWTNGAALAGKHPRNQRRARR